MTQHKYWRVYNEAMARLAPRDLAERCLAAGFRYDEAGIEVSFFDRRYILHRRGSTLTIDDEASGSVPTEQVGALSPEYQEEHLRDRILILHYLDQASGAPEAKSMVGFDQLIGARFYGKPFRDRVELPLVRAFASRPQLLLEIAQTLGGSAASYGDCSVFLRPFPRVPLAFILWQGDDEVPANGKILWDASAEGYLSAEDLTVLGETIVRKFRAGAAAVLSTQQRPAPLRGGR